MEPIARRHSILSMEPGSVGWNRDEASPRGRVLK